MFVFILYFLVAFFIIYVLLLDYKNSIINKSKRLRFSIKLNNNKIIGEKLMIQMTDVQFVEITLMPTDLRGNPAPVENIVWESSDPEMLELVLDPERPEWVKVNALGPVGTAQVNVTADVNMDPELVENMSDFVSFEIRTAFASNLGLNVTEPQNQIFE